MAEERFGITLTAQMRHGDLWRAAKQLGSGSALARHLGVSTTTMCKWINLKEAPNLRWLEERRPDVAEKLQTLCAKSVSELWPTELRAAILGGEIGQKIERTEQVAYRDLALAFRERSMLPAPDVVLMEEESHDVLEEMLGRLDKRQRRLLTLRFGLGMQPALSLEEVARDMGITRERVRQIEIRALKKLHDYGYTMRQSQLDALDVQRPQKPRF